MEQAQAEVAEVKPPSSSWKDFTLDEHIRAHVGCPLGCEIVIKPIDDRRYRVNVLRKPTDSFDNEPRFVKSVMISVALGKNGPIISDLG